VSLCSAPFRAVSHSLGHAWGTKLHHTQVTDSNVKDGEQGAPYRIRHHGDRAKETEEVGDDAGVPTKGVLFDWRGTLVNDPDDAWWVRTALGRIERGIDDAGVTEIVDRLREARELRSVVSAQATADCAAEQHRAATMLWFSKANLDSTLAEALYALDLEAVAHPFYEDVPETLQQLKTLGIKVAIVSDIHFDLRPEFEVLGLAGLVNAYILSFEHGVQKPDPRIFMLALEQLGLSASDALMVGDRPERDGGAVNAGIRTLLLPQESGPRRGLRSVVALVEA
jgi:HAD superfamily hydrolase (TIGR01509 family)